MIFYLRAKIINIIKQQIIIENNNIGYLIYVTSPLNYKINSEIILYLYIQKTDKNETYYGFNDYHQYSFFTNLITINNIGPKKALNILKNNDYNIIKNHINNNNLQALQQIKEIGIKLANEIIFKLQTKYLNYPWSIKQKQLYEVLKKLGYNENQIKTAVNNVNENLPLDIILKNIMSTIND